MFTPRQLVDRIKRRPFRSTRVRLTGGTGYDIHEPDLVIVGREMLTVGLTDTDDVAVADRLTHLAIRHITSLEDLPDSPKGGNRSAPPAR